MRPWLSSWCPPHVKLSGYKQKEKWTEELLSNFGGTVMVVWLCWKECLSFRDTCWFVYTWNDIWVLFQNKWGGGNFPISWWFFKLVCKWEIITLFSILVYIFDFFHNKNDRKTPVICVSFPFSGLVFCLAFVIFIEKKNTWKLTKCLALNINIFDQVDMLLLSHLLHRRGFFIQHLCVMNR